MTPEPASATPSAANPGGRRLTAHDQSFLDQEEPSSAMNVGGVVLFDGDRPDELLDDVLTRFASRLHLLPRLRQRLTDAPVDDAPNYWIDDVDFDLGQRVGPVDLGPDPSLAQVVALAGARVAEPLDRSRPLWDAAVVPRTAEGTGAVVIRWHHALVDGMSSVELAKLLFTTSPDDPVEPPEPWRPEPVDPTVLVAEEMAFRAAEAVGAAAERSLSGFDPDGTAEEGRRFLEGVASFAGLGSAPPNPFPPVDPEGRRYAVADVAEADLRRLARGAEVSAEVAVLSLVAGAIRQHLQALGRDDHEAMRILLPLTRPRRDRRTSLGNHATFNIVDLPIGPMAESERIGRVADVVATARASNQAAAAAAVIDSADRVPSSVNRAVARWLHHQSLVHGVVSYMRGPRRPLYLAGRRVTAAHPILPRSPGIGLLIGVMNLGGTVGFGLVADPRAVPALDHLTAGLRLPGPPDPARHDDRGSGMLDR